MNIAITGSSGLIGTALAASLRSDDHTVIEVTRSAAGDGQIQWNPAAGTIDATGFEGVDAVVHLAGEPIAAGPWTEKQRQKIHDSRTEGTRLLATALASLDRPPAVLVSGSAIGYYGDTANALVTEATGAGSDFLARICKDWEESTAPAEAAGIRVVHLRTGIVLDAEGGALAKQLPLYNLGLGGKAGKGTQWMSWISLVDEVRAIRFAIETESLRGAANLTAPVPVTNAEFTRSLASAVHRPALLPVPRFVRHLPFGIGDLLDSLLFTSGRIEPRALLDAGFEFTYNQLDDALAAIVAKD